MGGGGGGGGGGGETREFPPPLSLPRCADLNNNIHSLQSPIVHAINACVFTT